jgi:DNA-binding transcriptional MocR family regulator
MSKLYEQLAEQIAAQIDQGLYPPGGRIPGVRRLSQHFGVSVSTIVQAQRRLEDEGRIEARPRSGYYVRSQPWSLPEQPPMSHPSTRPTPVTGQELVLRLAQASNETDVVQLGAAIPDSSFLPVGAVQRALASAARLHGDALFKYQFPPGNLDLRRQIARRMLEAGCRIKPDEILITSGCQEALVIALQAVAKRGDVIAIESPAFYGLLQVIETLGMKALEIPTDPNEGISLSALSLALDKWPIKACVLVANFSNPLGYCMPDSRKKELLALVEDRAITIIEDDIYGDLGFGPSRPAALRSFDKSGRVIYCSSFSKTLSPGLRVGWMIANGCYQRAEYLKYVTNLAVSSLAQFAIADFLNRGGYDRYLRQVRSRYQHQVTVMIRAVGKYFPPGARVTQPRGGFVIWVELPKTIDAMQLYQQAMRQRISIAPGSIFSASQKYRNYIRLNCAQPWNERLERALISLGRMAQSLSVRTE